MLLQTADKPSDARLIGLAAREVRRSRRMTAQHVADQMNLPLRTYEYFESGAGRVNLDYVHRFASATDCDPWSLLVGTALGSVDFARRTADSKLMLIYLIALSEFEDRMGDGLVTLDPRVLIEAFTDAFRVIEKETLQRQAETRTWLEAGRDRLSGGSPDDA
jgi:hypothetical protein